MSDLTVSKTILEQLGGNRFIAMTGSNHFLGGADSLSFRLVPNRSKLRWMRIVLTPMDVYTVTLLNLKGVVGETHENVYAEDLRGLFTSITGLATSL